MKTVEIIGVPQSTFVRTVRIACEEKGVAYLLTPARPHTPEVDCIHPLGKVPVMRFGDYQLCESRAIATFVDHAFSGPKLFPDDAMLCGKIEQWVSIANTAIFPVMTTYLQAYFFPRTPDGQPDRTTIERVLPEVRSHISLVEKAVADNGCLADKSFTYADMNLLPILAYLRDCPETGTILTGAKDLTRYFDQHSQRESFKATVPPPFSELRSKAS